MRVAFMGKGGSGKTTLAAAFTRFCSKQQDFVLAFDGDLNVHLGTTLGIPIDPVSPRRQEIFDYLEGDQSSLEGDALERLAEEHQLAAYKHDGFWQCMDTLRDKRLLERLWVEGRAPWKV